MKMPLPQRGEQFILDRRTKRVIGKTIYPSSTKFEEDGKEIEMVEILFHLYRDLREFVEYNQIRDMPLMLDEHGYHLFLPATQVGLN